MNPPNSRCGTYGGFRIRRLPGLLLLSVCGLGPVSLLPRDARGEDAFRQTTVSADLRSYFFRRDFQGRTTDREDLALGGIVRLRRSLDAGLELGLSLYVSQGLGLNDDDYDVYGLLGKDNAGNHKDYAVLGEGFLRYRNGAASLTLGRQELNTPWLNLHDVRMTPQSFEALVLTHGGLPATHLTLAHVPRMKRKNETRFRAMSDVAAGQGDEPVTLAGLVHTGLPGLRLQLWDYLAHKVWNDVYLRLDWERQTAGGSTLRTGFRYLRRRAHGQALAGPLDTYHLGLTAALQTGQFRIRLAWSQNGDDDISRLFGHDTTISNQVYVADRAREAAWEVAADYRFGAQGWPGLKAGLSYSLADTPDTGVHASPDRGELNLDLQYSFGAALDGLSLRARYAVVDEWGSAAAENVRDTRLQLRYRVDL